MLDYDRFIASSKAMLIAPAGYGKTTAIAESVKRTEGRQLILTHTHAGVASIKSKLREYGVATSKYNVETISGYAQKYVLSFDTSGDLPPQANNWRYFPFIHQTASEFLKLNAILDIVSNSYNGLFVDEYQDCTIGQHLLITCLARRLPTRILGDPMQGIFGFDNQELVDLIDNTQMEGFIANRFELDIPYRWRNTGNEALGEELAGIRAILENRDEVDLARFSAIESLRIGEYETYDELYQNDKVLRQSLEGLEDEHSLLVIHPVPRIGTGPRESFIRSFGDGYALIESFDGRDFYRCAVEFDEIASENVHDRVRSFALEFLDGLRGWQPMSDKDKSRLNTITGRLESLRGDFSYIETADILRDLRSLPRLRCIRKDLYTSICSSLELAQQESISVSEAMVKTRNRIRKSGRRIEGKCIGTTLLTKGLEFDTVVVLNAEHFACPKNFYVAITRASKRLIVCTTSGTINPYGN